MDKKLANYEIVTLAVFLLGGKSNPIDAEDIAFKANQIAPLRFTWKKYKEQISIDNVRKRLWDAKKPKYGAYLIGSDKQGWQLTEEGLKFAEQNMHKINQEELARKPIDRKEQRVLRSEKERMLSSVAYEKFETDNESSITIQEACAFFRIDEYVIGEARERKILRAVNSFSDDPDLKDAVSYLAALARKV
jgi:hypothetical protein